MPKGIPSKPKTAVTNGTDKSTKIEARLKAAEDKVELLLKGLHAGHLAAAKALPRQRPGRQPRAN